MNDLCTRSTIVLLQDLMPLVTSKDICPGTWLVQYNQSWWLGHETTLTAQQNSIGHRKSVSKGTTRIFSSSWGSLTISQPNGGRFSQERRPEIKFYTKGLKRTAQPKNGMPASTQKMRQLGISIMWGLPNVNSVEPPLAPQILRRTGIPNATNDNHQLAVFMKAEHSQESTKYSDQPKCQLPRTCDYNISIWASIHYEWKLSQKLIAPGLDPRT
jgi:hypothetical protein